MSTTRWWNRDYVVDIEVCVFLDKGLWPKYWIKSKIILNYYVFNIVPYGI